MEKTIKIQPKELFYMLLVTIPPLLMLFIPNYANIYLGIDAWWIFAFISIIDIIFAFIIVRIGYLCPNKTVIGMCRYAFGELLGNLFGALFVTMYIFKSFMYFRQTLEYVYMSTYNLEPTYYYIIPMVLLVVIAQLYDSKTILRLSNLVFWLMMATYMILMISALRNFNVINLMPILVDGVEPVFTALPHFFTWTGNAVVLLMYFNKASMEKGLTRYVMLGCGAAYAIVLVLNVLFIGVFGIISGFFTTSVFELSIFFNGKIYFNNFDSIIKLVWIFGTFIRDSIFITCAAESTAELLNIKNSKWIKLMLPLAISVLSILIMKNEEMYFIVAMGIFSVLCASIQYGSVLVLWIGLAVKNKSRKYSIKGPLRGRIAEIKEETE